MLKENRLLTLPNATKLVLDRTLHHLLATGELLLDFILVNQNTHLGRYAHPGRCPCEYPHAQTDN